MSRCLQLLLLLQLVWSVEGSVLAPVCVNSDGCGGSIRGSPYSCGLYLAESAVQPGRLGVFSGVKRSAGEDVAEPEIVINLVDVKKNEWSPWNDMVQNAEIFPQALLESFFLNDIFIPGVAAMVACSNKYSNFAMQTATVQVDSAGVHRARHPSAGSFSYYHNVVFQATKDIFPGEELAIPCSDDSDQPFQYSNRKVSSVDFLQESGMCVDVLRAGNSTVPGAGRGAFAKQAIHTGEVIAPSPVVHFDRSQMEIVQQTLYGDKSFPKPRQHGIRYTDKVKGHQLLLNYCYGQDDSNILLLPYGPVVNYINMNSADKANAAIRWSTTLPGTEASRMKKQRPMELLARPPRDGAETLMIEFVALRDIAVGEEIFLQDDVWTVAWREHVQEWESKTSKDDTYISASDFLLSHNKEAMRTVEEQVIKPFPEKTRTGCYFSSFNFGDDIDEDDVFSWDSDNENLSCLRPCDIIKRLESMGEVSYTAVVYPMERFHESWLCGYLPEGGVTVNELPSKAVILMDRPYTTDMHQSVVFRREIRLPRGFYPVEWATADPNPTGDFVPTPLAPGQMDHIHWKDTGDVVLDNAYRLGLNPGVREVLLDYCDKMGITDVLHHVTVDDNGFLPGEEAELKLNDFNWYLQRPEKQWYSNLHWLSTADEAAHEDYLQTLGAAGFDEMLKGIGEHLGMDSLVVYHVTFIAVSQSTRGYIHSDVFNTGAKTFNVIVPLLKAEDSPPELDIQNEDGRLGRYSYEFDVGALMGDNSWHGTSAVDYRMNKNMRLAATIYLAEVTEDNVDAIINDYTQAFPPRDHDLLLSWAGRHWRRNDSTISLPLPSSGHVLANTATQ